jgi:hypothetical protein
MGSEDSHFEGLGGQAAVIIHHPDLDRVVAFGKVGVAGVDRTGRWHTVSCPVGCAWFRVAVRFVTAPQLQRLRKSPLSLFEQEKNVGQRNK